eukprot:5243290-Pyramimonas_sp.AAC.1
MRGPRRRQHTQRSTSHYTTSLSDQRKRLCLYSAFFMCSFSVLRCAVFASNSRSSSARIRSVARSRQTRISCAMAFVIAAACHVTRYNINRQIIRGVESPLAVIGTGGPVK